MLLDFLGLIVALIVIIYILVNLLGNDDNERITRIERKINQIIEAITIINGQLKIQDISLKNLTQEFNLYLEKTQNNPEVSRDKLDQLETLLTDIVEEVELIKTGKKEPKLLPIFPLNLEEFLSLYNQNSEVILQCPNLSYQELIEDPESENIRLRTKQKRIILSEPSTGAGIFWLVSFPEQPELYLLPKQLELSEANLETILSLFEGYHNNSSQAFKVIKPALVESIEEQRWQLVTKGEISEIS